MLLQGTLGGNFDIFAPSEESTAWVLLWKTRSRRIGVRVCPVAQFNFFGAAFDPREWTMAVFWKENSGHQPQLITPENQGGDETNYPSPPSDFWFFDDPDVTFGPQGPPPSEPPAPPRPPGPPGSPEQSGPPGPPPVRPPAPSPASDRERVRTGKMLCGRLHPRSAPPEPQLIPIPMSDGDDDQPPQERRRGERSRSRERVHPHALAPQVPQIQPLVTPEPDDISDEDFTDVTPSSPSAGPPPLAEQRGRSRGEERSRSREQVPPHSSSHATQQPQPAVPPSGAQQTQTLATQDSDEDSATVDPQNRVSDRSRSSQEQEGTRRQGPQIQKGKTTSTEKQASELPKAKKHKLMESDEDNEEPQNEPGTSSTSYQPTDPVLPFHQGPATSTQGPTVLDNSADEDSEYGAEYSAQSQDSKRTQYYPDLHVLTNDEHWTVSSSRIMLLLDY